MTDGEDLTVIYSLNDGSQRSYKVPALDLKKAYVIMGSVIKELVIFNQMEKAKQGG
jgi:hypothetical protein